MTKTLHQRHALVTGASRGIGYAIALLLLQQGARVTLMGRNEDSLKKAVASLAEHGDAAYVCGDVAVQSEVQLAFNLARQRFGLIQILVNNAGQAASERFDRIQQAQWDQMIAVNLTGTFHCIQAALPDMLAGHWGRVVNVASTAGLTGYPYVGAYCAAKHGVIGLTRALAQEVARQGVTVNAVCPGYTETDMVHEAAQNIVKKTGMSVDQAKDKLASLNPQGKLVQPDDVAHAVAWLCQPGAGALNGLALPVDGGEVMAG